MRCLFAIPGDINAPTGGYAYARWLLKHWPDEAAPLEHIELPGSFPFPSRRDLDESLRILHEASAGGGCALLIDGLAFGTFPPDMISNLRAPVTVLLHHPLSLETGLTEAEKIRLLDSERRALAHARHIVVTSPETARSVRALFAFPEGRITVAEPGIEGQVRSSGSAMGDPLHIVSAGTLTPRKGHSVLADALHLVRDLDWRATIAGSLEWDAATAQAVQAQVATLGLGNRIRFTGTLDEAALAGLYASADIFALASYYEGYGMVFAEAMAHGLPIICSGSGAVRETAPVGAGLHVEAGQPRAFADALRHMITDSKFRERCAAHAFAHAQTLPSWRDTAQKVARVMQAVAE